MCILLLLKIHKGVLGNIVSRNAFEYQFAKRHIEKDTVAN